MKKLFSIMLGRYFALAFLLFFSGKSFAENDNYTRAADTFKAIEKLMELKMFLYSGRLIPLTTI